MAEIVSTLLWLLNVVGQPAYVATPGGAMCAGTVDRMGVATFTDCPGAQWAECVWVAERPGDEPEECEPVGFAQRKDWRMTDIDGWHDDWELHFASDEPEGWD